MLIEQCGLYKKAYYGKQCELCKGTDLSKLCYITEKDLKDHLQNFYNRFQIEDDSWNYKSFGMGFDKW